MNRVPLTVLAAHASDEMYGSDFCFLQVMRALRRDGARVVVVLPDDVEGDRPLSVALAEEGCVVKRMRLAVLRRRYFRPLQLPRFFVAWFFAVVTLWRLIEEVKPDIVYSNTLAVSAPAFAARFRSVPHVWHVHEIVIQPRWLGMVLARVAAWLSCRVVAASTAVDKYLHRAAPGIRSTVVHSGVPDPTRSLDAAAARAWVEDQLSIDPCTPLVAFVGRVSEWKGATVFAEVASEHIRSGGSAHFVVVGGTVPGETNVKHELLRLVGDPANRGALHWIDYTDKVAAFLMRADVFVLPSVRPDPFPTVVLEAMYAGLPIVTFAHGGVLEMISDAEAGKAVPVGDANSLRGAIEALLDDGKMRSEMGRRGRAHALTAFTPARYQAEVLQVFDDSIAERT